jgi:NAD(P)-dependent dehydrogenase (short-subunit alcohol dehydrogenase family)
VTGSTSGIGKATAISLLKDGYIVFAGVRSVEKGDDLKNEAAKKGLDAKR